MVEALQAEGFSAVQLAKGMPDEDILALARQNNAVVVTANIKDFKGRGVMTMEVHPSMTARGSVGDVVGKIKGVAGRDPYHAAFTNDSNIRLMME